MNDAFRTEVRDFLETSWDPERYLPEIETRGTVAGGPPAGAWHAKLQEARLVAPHWPVAYGGRGLGPLERAIVIDELNRIGAPGPGNPIGLGWAGPTLMLYGTEDQRSRFLLPIVEGTEIWCQLFSEPNAGSDLASLTTVAVRDGDEYVITGQKVWSSLAYEADWGILLARTDAGAPRHRGITYFLIDMDQRGIEVRRIKQMTGESEFCEVFFDHAHADHVVGEVDGGWRVAVGTLQHERMNLSTGQGILWGSGPPFSRYWEFLVQSPHDPVGRERLSDLWVRFRILELMKRRLLEIAARGELSDTTAGAQKLLADRFGQDVAAAVVGVAPGGGLLWHDPLSSPGWEDAFLFSRALTVGGGTEEIQKNILAERGLGLPPDPEVGARPAKIGR